jgi:cytochrome c-type biogenesis protein CcmE
MTDTPDLSPRPSVPTAVGRRRGRRLVPMLILAGVFVAGGIVLTQALSTAVDYYCNADEVDVRDGCEAGRRLRLQGTVAEGSVLATAASTTFDIEFGAATVAVEYEGEPGGIFKECIPVVVHGQFDDSTGLFKGDRVEVKHSDEYVSVNDDRLTQAEESACQPSA